MVRFAQSDRIRDIVLRRYIGPAVKAGGRRISVRARDVLKDAEASETFPRGRTPLVCSVLQSKKLLNEAGLEIESVDGPPSRQSRTVVVHYRVVDPAQLMTRTEPQESTVESPADRAYRLTERLRGLLKKELAEYGGAEGFIRWVRSDED